MTRSLEGKRALVTGANGGVGSAIAVGLAREGASVAVQVRRAGLGNDVCSAISEVGGSAYEVVGDVSVRASVEDFVAQAEEALGGIDVLVNNAGINREAPFLDITEEDWRAVLDTNLSGYFFVGQAVARGMVARGSGSIVNVSSTRQVQAWAGSTAYAASKGGISMLTRSMALELAPLGVRVNSIAPGTFITNLNRHYLTDPDFAAKRIAMIPAGRYGELEELASAVVFLTSDASSFTIGASIMIDGGQTLG